MLQVNKQLYFLQYHYSDVTAGFLTLIVITIYLSIYLSVCVCLPACVPAYLSIYLYLSNLSYLSILSICLSIYVTPCCRRAALCFDLCVSNKLPFTIRHVHIADIHYGKTIKHFHRVPPAVLNIKLYYSVVTQTLIVGE